MKTLLSAVAIGLAAFTAADRVEATQLNYAIDAPVIDLPFATADYAEFSGTGDLTMFFAEGLATGTPQSGDLFVDLVLGFDPLDPAGTAFGSLFSVDDDGAFLDGDVLRTGFDGDVLQVVFGNLTGKAAGDFGRFALLELVFIFPSAGTDPLTTLIDGEAYDVAGTIYAATPIPVPAALPLMAAALGGLVLLRRRR
ncbi:PEP-CTERM sorting domain-containing protein [Meridianimarinicoccus sp. RP-17]|uniref:PEP-CTERM sorting domain-containing protein n=1 Tax=Meridianimarinicoccus zhengii TaxID=2056810 RepID=UPI000DAC65C7|nr:PEP-CTERM sorting domain-containing protein [Phycocomes zhengii]